MPTATWRLDPPIAIATFADFQGRLTAADPADGMHQIAWQGRLLEAVRLFRIASPSGQSFWRNADANFHARGDDFFCSYPADGFRGLGMEVRWTVRKGDAPVRAMVDLLVSLQTDCLDLSAELRIATFVSSDHVAPIGEQTQDGGDAPCAGVLCSQVGAGLSYAQFVRPCAWNGPRSLSVEQQAAGAEIAYGIHMSQFEKGVILRSQLRGVFLDADADMDLASQLQRQFHQSDPPLTS